MVKGEREERVREWVWIFFIFLLYYFNWCFDFLKEIVLNIGWNVINLKGIMDFLVF